MRTTILRLIKYWFRGSPLEVKREIPKDEPTSKTLEDAIDPALVKIYGTIRHIHPATTPIMKHSFRKVSQTKNAVSLDYDGTSGWSQQTIKKTVQAHIYIIFQYKSEWVCGQFDYLRPNQSTKGLENLWGGRIGGMVPAAGSDVYYFICNLEGTERYPIIKQEQPWKS